MVELLIVKCVRPTLREKCGSVISEDGMMSPTFAERNLSECIFQIFNNPITIKYIYTYQNGKSYS